MTIEATHALGRLLSVVADCLHEVKVLARRGPSRARRLASLLLGLIATMMVEIIRQVTIASRVNLRLQLPREERSMRHPPQAWAAP